MNNSLLIFFILLGAIAILFSFIYFFTWLVIYKKRNDFSVDKKIYDPVEVEKEKLEFDKKYEKDRYNGESNFVVKYDNKKDGIS